VINALRHAVGRHACRLVGGQRTETSFGKSGPRSLALSRVKPLPFFVCVISFPTNCRRLAFLLLELATSGAALGHRDDQ
jgi:hypothetical protein